MDTCTVLLRDVLRLSFSDLDSQGTLHRLLDDTVYNSDIDACSNPSIDETGDSSEHQRLDLTSLAGVFVIHGAVMCLGYVLWAANPYYKDKPFFIRFKKS